MAINAATPASPAVTAHRIHNVVIGSTSMFERPPNQSCSQFPLATSANPDLRPILKTC